MSDIIKLNIKSKNIRAVVSDTNGEDDNFTEFTEILEKEKEESAHKQELKIEFERGFEEGKQTTTEELEEIHSQELLRQSEDFYNIIKTFEDKIKSYENNFHRLVINVAGRISEKILKKELTKKSIIEKTLNENLGKIIGANEIVIKLNPADHTLLENSNKEYMASNNITKIRFETSENIKIGTISSLGQGLPQAGKGYADKRSAYIRVVFRDDKLVHFHVWRD